MKSRAAAAAAASLTTTTEKLELVKRPRGGTHLLLSSSLFRKDGYRDPCVCQKLVQQNIAYTIS
ncbi:Uncharacterized protein APZ42_018727 [Daphnia magna]|uniref:Uncharacterized protein n=1 Tax=Daphnia magna TaxID=35525 RepID=A0A0P5V5S7_9CRUS|nr:Uncharacterized protein APZ42_018727 [Daphnia magna]